MAAPLSKFTTTRRRRRCRAPQTAARRNERRRSADVYFYDFRLLTGAVAHAFRRAARRHRAHARVRGFRAATLIRCAPFSDYFDKAQRRVDVAPANDDSTFTMLLLADVRGILLCEDYAPPVSARHFTLLTVYILSMISLLSRAATRSVTMMLLASMIRAF